VMLITLGRLLHYARLSNAASSHKAQKGLAVPLLLTRSCVVSLHRHAC
jgi:hypothetical protein